LARIAHVAELDKHNFRYRNLPVHFIRAGGFLVSGPCRSEVLSAHFFGEASERRPWPTKREERPSAFAGRSKSPFAVPQAVEIPPLPIQASILSHSTSSNCSFSAPRRRESEKPARDIVRMPGATTATHYSAVRCKSERPSGSGQAGQPSILQWKRQPSERNQSQTRRAEPNSAKRSNTVRMAPVTDSSG